MKVQVHKVTIFVLDMDGLGPKGVAEEFEATRYANHCMSPEVIGMASKWIDFEDDCPLNQNATHKQAIRELFPAEGSTHA